MQSFALPQLSLALAGLPRHPGQNMLRQQIEAAPGLGFRAVTLDAMLPGVRARELDRSGRRDLAALLRRRELACTGLDLWIPAEHFASTEHVDRAMSALLGAIELAADLGRLSASAIVSTSRSALAPTVSTMLPAGDLGDGGISASLRAQIEERAATCGVCIADHAWPAHTYVADAVSSSIPIEESGKNRNKPDAGVSSPKRGSGGVNADSPLGIGLDPAAVLLAGGDPVRIASSSAPGATAEAASLPRRLYVARLTDASSIGRVPIGVRGGRLDTLAYGVALVTSGYRSHVVVDVRGLPTPESAARRASEQWSELGPA